MDLKAPHNMMSFLAESKYGDEYLAYKENPDEYLQDKSQDQEQDQQKDRSRGWER